MLRPREPRPRQEWTAERLRTFLATSFRGERIVVLANRQPFRHDRAQDGSLSVTHSAGGLVTTLEPLLEATGGVWVAHGNGNADRSVVDRQDRLAAPTAKPSYRLRRVWLGPDEERGYYGGFSNEGLWPLCHRAGVRPIFRAEDFFRYRTVNARFADTVCEEADRHDPLVLVQDYHFALAPRAIRERLPLSTTVTFWHIPWPSPRDYRACPWGTQLIEGLLGSSIVGFQTRQDCQNFLETVESTVDAGIDRRRQIVTWDDRQVLVRAYPASVEWPSRVVRQLPDAATCRADVCRQLGLPPDIRLIVGVDRLDYTKGLDEKVRAVERLLETHSEYQGRVVLVQIAEPSRSGLAPYQAYRSRLIETTRRVNARFARDGYEPIVLLEARHDPREVYKFLRAAEVCYVGSLHDGMNLVAKEFVVARNDHRGVLVLSQFAGSARELTEALLIDPHDLDQSANTLLRALCMTGHEQSLRLRAMRSIVKQANTYQWAGTMLSDAAEVRGNLSRHVCEVSGRPDRLPASA